MEGGKNRSAEWVLGVRAKKSPDVETPGLWYLDLISVVDWTVKI